MTLHIEAHAVCNNFAELLKKVHDEKQVIIVEHGGKPMAAMIPVEMYERFVTEREARFQVLNRIRRRLPEIPSEEVEQDIAKAIAAVRSTHAESGT